MILGKRLLIFLIFLIQAQSIVAVGQPVPAVSESIRIQRLAGLCELWGVVKYFHPYLAYKDIDWDEAMIKTIPKVNKAETAEDYKRAVEYMLSFLKDPNTYVYDASYEFPRSKISDVSDEEDCWKIIWTEDDIAIIVANDFNCIYQGENYYFDRFMEDDRQRWKGIIIDARCLKGPGINKFGDYPSGILLERLKFRLLGATNETIVEPSVRSRTYYSLIYPDSRSQWNMNWHESAFLYRDNFPWSPEEDYSIKKVPVIFIINEGSADLLPTLSVLQDKKRGAIIFEGTFDREGGIETYNVQLPDDIIVKVRLTEIVRSDGTEAVHPDLVIPYTTDAKLLDCPPIKTALDIIKGRRQVPPAVGNFLSPVAVLPAAEMKTYGNMPAPKLEYRLLALFRYWNEIMYFCPYPDEIGSIWNCALKELIPVFEAAVGERAYESAVETMIGKSGNRPISYFGFWCYPSFNVDFVENQTVVTYTGYRDSSFSLAELNVGDIVLALDGEDISELRKRLAGFISAPTPQALEESIHECLLGAVNPSQIGIKVRKHNGRVEEYELPRRYGAPRPERRNFYPGSFQLLDENIMYIWGYDLDQDYMRDSLDNILNLPALIIDLRRDWYVGFPLMEGKRMASIFAEKEAVACLLRGIERRSPDLDKYSFAYSREMVVPDTEYNFKGKVVVLIDASTHGISEKLCLHFNAATDVIYVGMPTSGFPGRYTEIYLPGDDDWRGRKTRYIGLDVRHPDDSPVYGVGIQPDIYVEPTIEGIRQGRDEILEAAIEYLKKELKQ